MPEFPQEVGQATHFTTQEGGSWYKWTHGVTSGANCFAIKFESGWIWDRIVGWRKAS